MFEKTGLTCPVVNGRSTTSFHLEHQNIEREPYEELFAQCTRSNLLQSAAYGEAKRRVENYGVVRKVVLEGGMPLAIYQVLVKRLPLLGTVARINRGPLYLGDGRSVPGGRRSDIYRSLYEEWIGREGVFLQIAPDLPDEGKERDMMAAAGFVVDPSGNNWESGWVALTGTEEGLRKGLQQKWRNMLNKAEKAGIEILPVEGEEKLARLLEDYDAFMREKKFQSTSGALIKALHLGSPGSLCLLAAYREGRRIGAVIIARHGDSCTYLVGFTSGEGRKCNANYLLLWTGLLGCRRDGFRWFDVGGIDDENTPGVAHFKRGLGMVPYRLAGEYEGRSGWRPHLLAGLKKCYLGVRRGRSILGRVLGK